MRPHSTSLGHSKVPEHCPRSYSESTILRQQATNVHVREGCPCSNLACMFGPGTAQPAAKRVRARQAACSRPLHLHLCLPAAAQREPAKRGEHCSQRCGIIQWTIVCMCYCSSKPGAKCTSAGIAQGSQSGRGAQSTSRALRPGMSQGLTSVCPFAAHHAQHQRALTARLECCAWQVSIRMCPQRRCNGQSASRLSGMLKRPEKGLAAGLPQVCSWHHCRSSTGAIMLGHTACGWLGEG